MGVFSSRFRVVLPLVGVCMLVLASAGTSGGGATLRIRVPHHGFGPLDSTLGQIAAVEKAHGTVAALAAATSQNVDVAQGKVAVMVTARPGRPDAAIAAVAAAGGTTQRSAGDLLQALVPPAALESLAADAAISAVRRPPIAVADTTDEAVAATNASSVQAAGFDGTGVKVAVIDLGFQNLNTVFGSSLPPWLSTYNFSCTGTYTPGNLNGLNAWGPTPHGTAVAEIVHQMAPGAQVELMCVNGILDLQAAEARAVTDGVKVINHSVSWFDVGRGDGTGGTGTPDPLVADARGHGILWVNSAGNYAGDHWSGTFLPSAADPSLNDFSGGGGDVTNDVTIGAGQQACIFMKWDAWPVTTEDYDWGLFRSSDGALVAQSTNDQSSGPAPPTESNCYTNSGATQNFEIAISRYSAVLSPQIDLWIVGGVSNLQYATAAGSITEPASSPDALAVGAECWQSGTLEPFSSQGPTIDGRADPAILAPDGTSSSIYGSFSGCGTTSSGFFGTSAAAPHVAGAAALLAQAYPSVTSRRLERLLRSQLATPSSTNLWLHPPYASGPFVFSNGQVVLANSDGTDSHVLTNDSSIIYSPALSPDGSRIAFVATQDGNPEIYVMNTDGSGRIRLTNNSVIDQDPTWSPDGLQIAFSSNRSGNFDIYKTDSTFGVPVTQLTTGSNNETQPDWSSTGKIAFTTDVNVAGFHHWDIFTMNASDGSSQTDLTNNAPSASNVDPAWSPDGSKIAFIGGTSGAPAYTMNANGSSVTSVTSGLGGALDPAWSPDGTRLLFESGSSDVYSAKTDGTMLARLTSGLNVQSAPSDSPAVVPPYAWISGSVSGALRVGQPMAGVPPAWIGSPFTLTYQWQKCLFGGCIDIPNATDTVYTPVAADAGYSLMFETIAQNTAGARLSMLPTGTIRPQLPTIVASPTITGTAQQGQTLSVLSSGIWNNPPTFFYYQWRRCASDGGSCVDIPGPAAANTTAYVLQAADVGSTIRIAVATFAGTAASSVPTPVVAAAGAGGGGGGGGGGGSGGSGGGSGGSGGGGGGSGGVYPDLSVLLTADATTAPAVGSELVYHFTVADKVGTVTAFNTFADVTLPAGYTMTNTYADRGPGCLAGSPGLVCNLDFVQPGSDGHVTIWGTVGQAGPLTISVHVRHFLNEGNPADDTATLTLQPAVSGTGGGDSGGTTGQSPKTLTPPFLVGGVTVGSVLRAIPPTWSAKPSRVRYQWQLCRATGCSAIGGATALRLKLKLGYAGKSVRIVATATIAGKTVKSTSKKIAVKRKA